MDNMKNLNRPKYIDWLTKKAIQAKSEGDPRYNYIVALQTYAFFGWAADFLKSLKFDIDDCSACNEYQNNHVATACPQHAKGGYI